MNTISWLEKYRPQTLSEYYISKQQLDIVKKWIKDFRNNELFGSTNYSVIKVQQNNFGLSQHYLKPPKCWRKS